MPRGRTLRLLKADTALTLGTNVPVLGHDARHVAQWWQRYRSGGLVGLWRSRHGRDGPRASRWSRWPVWRKRCAPGAWPP